MVVLVQNVHARQDGRAGGWGVPVLQAHGFEISGKLINVYICMHHLAQALLPGWLVLRSLGVCALVSR